MLRRLLIWSMSLTVCASFAFAQQERPPRESAVPPAPAPWYRVAPPPGFADGSWTPLVLLFGDGAAADATREALNAGGGVVVHVYHHERMGELLTRVRQQFRIAGGGMHLVAIGAAVGPASKLVTEHGWQFQSVALFGGALDADLGPWLAVAGRSGVWHTDRARTQDDAKALRTLQRDAVEDGRIAEVAAQHVATVREARAFAGPAAEVDRALDDFHDAASVGDEDRYFRLLPDDAVFLGTDATERWTGAQFRDFAMPYFRRDSAWTYVPVSRHVELGGGGAFAWFDEVLDNEAYGECRGSGVLERRGERWVLRQYNLVIPVPNDLARGLVERARSLARGAAPAMTTVVVVRHGEKGEGEDPDLNDAGRARSERLRQLLADVPLTAVFASEYRRTQQTVAPAAAGKGLSPTVHPARDVRGLAARIRRDCVGGTVLVAGHSNTVGPLLAGLGVAGRVELTEQDYGDVFVVVLSVDGAKVVRLQL